MPGAIDKETLNELNKLTDSLLSVELPAKILPNEEELKQQFPFGDWSVDSIEELLDVRYKGIQEILRHMSGEQLIHTIYQATDELKQYMFSNMSGRYSEMMQADLAKAKPSQLEIKEAQLELMRVAKEQVALLEQREWEELMLLLPKDPLPDKADLAQIFSMNENDTKAWMDKVKLIILIHAMAMDDEWNTLWEKKVEPLISKKALDLRESEMDSLLPQFAWQIEIARRLITYHATTI